MEVCQAGRVECPGGNASTETMAVFRSAARASTPAAQCVTPAERELWQHLRRGQLSSFGFRRQYPMGPFILDFYCPAARLVVEVDGDVHAQQVEYDVERTTWLEQQRRCRMLRFTNEDVLHNLEAVLEAILAALERPPP